ARSDARASVLLPVGLPRWRRRRTEQKGQRRGVYHRCYGQPAEPVVSSGAAKPGRPSGRPVADTRILLLGDATSDPLVKVLGRPGRALTRVEDPEQIATAAVEHDVIVLDVVPAPRSLA